MADITAFVKDGLGLGDNSNKTAKSKAVNDYVEINTSAVLNGTTDIEEITDGIYETIIVTATTPSVPEANGGISLGDNTSNDSNNVVSQQATKDYLTITDTIAQEAFVSITSPNNASEHLYRDILTFSGVALKNGVAINPDKIKWSSSIDGVFKEGNNFNYDRLSVGVHDIRMYMEDEKIDNQITLTIKRNNKPNRPENLTEA